MKAKKQGEMGEREEPVMGGLFRELVEEILDRIPIKPLTRMKCLSKDWCRLISQYRQSRSHNSSSLFFYQYTTPSPSDRVSQIVFFNSKEHEGQLECIENNSLSFSITPDMYCLGCSKGLLLWTKIRRDSYQTVYICNSTIDQWISIPEINILRSVVKTVVMGLAFDGVADHHYKVVCFGLDTEDICRNGYITYSIFSSDRGSWREHTTRFRSACSLMLMKNYSKQTHQYFYRKGKIHWMLDDYMLVYHTDECFFELIKLPSKEENQTKGLYPKLWESEGRLCYTYSESRNKVLHIFAYVNDNADMGAEEFTSGNWQLKHTIKLATMKAQQPILFCGKFVNWFEPFGFDEDMQVVYIQLSHMIVCYSLETREWIKACDLGMFVEDMSDHSYGIKCLPRRSFCMQSSEVKFLIGDDCNLLMYPKRISGSSSLSLVPCDS